MVQEDGGAAHALDADLERDPSAQRGLLENQRKKPPAERAAVTIGSHLDACGQVIELADQRRAPFGAGKKVAGEQQGGGRGVHVHLVAASAIGRAGASCFSGACEAVLALARRVLAKTVSSFARNSRTCCGRIMNGGSRRSVQSCVQLISRPCRSAVATYGPPSTPSSRPRM